MDSNSTLIALLQKGDETAFREIYNRFYQPVLKNIAKWESDVNTQEDILQEVFIELWSKKEQLSTEMNIGGWLFKASYHRTISHLRKLLKVNLQSIHEHDLETVSPVSEDDALSGEELYLSKLSLLKSAIELLPEQKKKTFIMYKIQGLSYVEIARQMGISELSVRQYVKTAVSHLRQMVKLSEADLYIFCTIVFSPAFFVNNSVT